MGFRRYLAPTAREALERIRKELGPDAIILSNKRSGPGRVEIIAAAPGEVRALVDHFEPAEEAAPVARAKKPAVGSAGGVAERARAVPAAANASARVAPESFQQFIRRQTTMPAPRIGGVAMYNSVALESDEEVDDAPAARPAPIAPREESPPAVFRRRPSRLQPASASAPPAATPVRAAVAPAAPAPALAAPVATVASPAPVAQPMPAMMQPVMPAQMASQMAPQMAPQVALQMPTSMPAQMPQPAQQAMPIVAQPAMQAPPQMIAPIVAPVASAPVPAEQTIPAQMALTPMQLQAVASMMEAAVAKVVPPAAPVTPAAPAPMSDSRVMAELATLRSMLSDRIKNLEAQIAPIASNGRPAANGTDGAAPLAAKRAVMTRLLMSGFSPELARRAGELAPATLAPREADAWLQQLISQQLRCPVDTENPLHTPGAVALVGPTGVGKTTTVAKLAARFVVRHGASALGMITIDSYRIGAHEQLRSYGRILGVPVQNAHDAASLGELLRTMHGKRKVLIDTCGMSQRDPRLAEMLSMLAQARFAEQPVHRVLLVNAASHAETLDEVVRAWQVETVHGAVLTKIDEAARIGGALDAMMRYRLALLGLTNGQRVPEDWHPGNAPLLAHIALKPFGSAFALDSSEVLTMSKTGVQIAG